MLCFWSKIAGPAAGWGKARLGFQGESFRSMGNNQGRSKVSAQRGEPGRGRPHCVRGPSAGGQVASCQLSAPLAGSGRGWPNGHSLSWPGVACSPNCLQTPRFSCLCSCCSKPWEAPFSLPKLALGQSAHCEDLKRKFWSLFPRALSYVPLACCLRKQRCWSPPGALLYEVLRAPESLHCIVSLYLFADGLPAPQPQRLVGSSWPATCVPALTWGLAPPLALNLLVPRVTGTRVYALQFEPSQKEQFLVALQLEGSDPNRQNYPAPFPPWSLKTCLLPENLGPDCRDTCSLIRIQRQVEGGSK